MTFFECCGGDTTVQTVPEENIKLQSSFKKVPVESEGAIVDAIPKEIKRANKNTQGDNANSSVGDGSITNDELSIFNPNTLAPLLNNVDDGDAQGGEEVTEPTTLYQAVEDKDWNGTLVYLSTGKKGDEFGVLSKKSRILDHDNPAEEARKWIVRTDWWDEIEFRRLPLHCAIISGAPSAVVQKLVEVNPKSVKAADHDGNLPAHHAFKHNASDGVIAFLLNLYPEAVSITNKENKVPVHYAKSTAGEIIQLCVDQTNEASKKEEEKLYLALESEKNRLSEILKQLSQVRGELDEVKGRSEQTSYMEMDDLAGGAKSIIQSKTNWRPGQEKADIKLVDEEVERMKEELFNHTNNSDSLNDGTSTVTEEKSMISKETGSKSRKLKRLFGKKKK